MMRLVADDAQVSTCRITAGRNNLGILSAIAMALMTPVCFQAFKQRRRFLLCARLRSLVLTLLLLTSTLMSLFDCAPQAENVPFISLYQSALL